jgi:hypothetical protein
MRALLQWTDPVVAETRRAAPYDDISMDHGDSFPKETDTIGWLKSFSSLS